MMCLGVWLDLVQAIWFPFYLTISQSHLPGGWRPVSQHHSTWGKQMRLASKHHAFPPPHSGSFGSLLTGGPLVGITVSALTAGSEWQCAPG